MCKSLGFTFRTLAAVLIHLLGSETEGHLPWRMLWQECFHVMVLLLARRTGESKGANNNETLGEGGVLGTGGGGVAKGSLFYMRITTRTRATIEEDVGGGVGLGFKTVSCCQLR